MLKDVEEKLTFVCDVATVVRDVCLSLANEHTARSYARFIFLAVDEFIRYARVLRNARFPASDAHSRLIRDDIGAAIDQLERDYRGTYETVRDKMAAHAQTVDLLALLSHWADIDDSAIVIITDQLQLVHDLFVRHGALAQRRHHALVSLLAATAALPPADQRPRFGASLLFGTQKNVGGIIPCHPNQEKAQRILTIIDAWCAIADLSHATQSNDYAHFATWALIVIDLLSLITNTFESKPADREGPSLLEMWKTNSRPYDGVPVLEAFRRDMRFETDMVERRNRAFAHIDDSDDIAAVKARYSTLNTNAVASYMNALVSTVYRAFQHDFRTQMFALHGQLFPSTVISVEQPEPFRPFRAAGQPLQHANIVKASIPKTQDAALPGALATRPEQTYSAAEALADETSNQRKRRRRARRNAVRRNPR